MSGGFCYSLTGTISNRKRKQDMARRRTIPGVCSICQQPAPLTFEHAPPQAAYNKATAVAYRIEDFPAFFFLGNGWSLLFPAVALVVVLAVLLFFMHYTVHGRYLYAIGFNVEAARFSGVRIHRLRIVSYALCGLLAGLAGLIEASSVKSVAPSTAGMAYELYGITAAVLGGCALRGGQGSLVGVVIGAAILKVLQKMIIFLSLPTHLTDAVIGLVLLAAVIADALVKRRRGY